MRHHLYLLATTFIPISKIQLYTYKVPVKTCSYKQLIKTVRLKVTKSTNQ